MPRTALTVVGAIVALLGVIFSLQGFGVLQGSPMSSTTFWAVAGPIIVGVGLVIVWLGTRRRR
jgi:hypothetical protein